MKLKANTILLGALCLSSVSGEITVVGNSTGYTSNDGNWLSNTTNDIDENGLGSDGFIFFGDYQDNGSTGGNPFTLNVSSTPSYISNLSAGARFVNIAEGFGGYGVIDNPSNLDGSDSVAGFALATNGGAGTNNEIVTFTVSGLASEQTVRVGVLAGIESNNDGRWDPSSITVSDGAGSSATVGSLPSGSPNNTGWVFFDLDADGTYGVSTTKRKASQGSGIGGLTFDSSVPVTDGGVNFPKVSQAELRFLQNEDGADGDSLSTAVREFCVTGSEYGAGTVIPLAGFKPGAVHKLVVNTSGSDSVFLAEFSVVDEDGQAELEVFNFAQTGASQVELLNVGSAVEAGALELAFDIPANLGDITITHYVSSLDSWIDSTQYGNSHFHSLGAESVISDVTLHGDITVLSSLTIPPGGNVSMGEFGAE